MILAVFLLVFELLIEIRLQDQRGDILYHTAIPCRSIRHGQIVIGGANELREAVI